MLNQDQLKSGVYFLSKLQPQFSSIYLDVREKEERVYSDKVTSKLPNTSTAHKYHKEWCMRQKSTKRIKDYLTQKGKPLKILDLGCGNGWFSNQLAEVPNTEVYGVDINDIELEQAARVFKKETLHFIYLDIFSDESRLLNGFDIITINSCIQYFNDFRKTIDVLNSKLNEHGELHIVDSPFYKTEEINHAKERTLDYYHKLGFPEMAGHYYHHSWNDLFDFDTLYRPQNSKIKKLLGISDTPFYWIYRPRV